MGPDNTTISSEVLRGYIDLMILRVLISEDSYGYEISKKITEMSQNTFTMKETTLYSAFARLAKLGYLDSYPGIISGGRERTYYFLTPAGHEHYRRRCTEWEHTKKLIENFIIWGIRWTQ